MNEIVVKSKSLMTRFSLLCNIENDFAETAAGRTLTTQEEQLRRENSEAKSRIFFDIVRYFPAVMRELERVSDELDKAQSDLKRLTLVNHDEPDADWLLGTSTLAKLKNAPVWTDES